MSFTLCAWASCLCCDISFTFAFDVRIFSCGRQANCCSVSAFSHQGRAATVRIELECCSMFLQSMIFLLYRDRNVSPDTRVAGVAPGADEPALVTRSCVQLLLQREAMTLSSQNQQNENNFAGQGEVAPCPVHQLAEENKISKRVAAVQGRVSRRVEAGRIPVSSSVSKRWNPVCDCERGTAKVGGTSTMMTACLLWIKRTFGCKSE